MRELLTITPSGDGCKECLETGHPIIQAYKSTRGDWNWCYVDETYVDRTPDPAP